ncbi:MAG: glycosyltransferase [Ruminococcus sp.]|nr:glycosyltransferase [Ruminococcus sp.]
MNKLIPEFSIIIPVYNTVKELPRCINSILEQTFSNFEVILVDDGSTDGSSQLCDELASGDSRIMCIHKKNGGASEARNTGINSATGNYLMFVDSDDMWEDANALFDINNIITSKSGLDVLCFGVEILDENGKLVKERKPILPKNIEHKKESILRHMVYTNQYFSASYVKVLRREFFLNNDLFFVKGLLSGEDIEWSARVMVHCKSINIYSSTFYKRIRRTSGSITSAIKEKNVVDVLNAIENGIQYAEKNSENDDLLNIYYEYWAYQYAMLLGLAGNIKKSLNYKDIIIRLKKLKWLLRYNNVKKVHAVHFLCSVCGIKKTVELLAFYYRLK